MTADQAMQALIFDFDGVVVDTEHLHWEAFNQVLAPRDLQISWESYRQEYMGFDDRGVLQRIHEQHGRQLSPGDQQELINTKAAAFIRVVARTTLTPFPGVTELIREAGACMPVGLCTGALASDIEPILQRLHLGDAFSARVTADEVTVSKPDPESYAKMLGKLAEASGRSPDPARCMVIEDTPAGIAAAQGAGLCVTAVTNSYSRPELHAADWVVPSLSDVSCTMLSKWLSS